MLIYPHIHVVVSDMQVGDGARGAVVQEHGGAGVGAVRSGRALIKGDVSILHHFSYVVLSYVVERLSLILSSSYIRVVTPGISLTYSTFDFSPTHNAAIIIIGTHILIRIC